MGVTAVASRTPQRLAVDAIADALAETAIADGARCTWLSATVELPEGQREIVHRTGNPVVYDGDAGIAWALAHASRALRRADLGELARAGAAEALLRADPSRGGGLLDGVAGVGVAAMQTGAVLGDEQLIEAGLEVLGSTTEATAGDDVVSGTAGLILASLAAADESGDSRWLDRATDLARVLAARADRRPWGWSWPSGEDGEPGLCGLAHGCSGVAWALAELGARTGSDEFGEAVREALQYERSWFDRERGNWPDLRLTDSGAAIRSFPAWWCHGAAGVGLVRLRLWELGLADLTLLAEAGASLRATFSEAAAPLRAGQVGDFGVTVCHGLGGAVELFLTAHAVLGEKEHQATVGWLLDRVIGLLGYDVEWWPDGVGAAGASPGLATGMAGTLLVLLRAMGSGDVPSPGLFPLGRSHMENPTGAGIFHSRPVSLSTR